MMWEIGAINETHLRLTAAGIFGGPLGRRYWSEARDARRVAEKGRRARVFYSIIDNEYQKVLRRRRGEGPGTAPIGLDRAVGQHLDKADAPPTLAAEPLIGGPEDRPPAETLIREQSAQSGLENAIWLLVGAVVGAAAARLFVRRGVLPAPSGTSRSETKPAGPRE